MGTLAGEDLEDIWVGHRYKSMRHLLSSPSPLTVCRLCFARGWKKAEETGWASTFVQKLRDGLGEVIHPRPNTIQPILTIKPENGRPGTPFGVTLELAVEGKPPQGTFDVHVFATGPGGQTQKSTVRGDQPYTPPGSIFGGGGTWYVNGRQVNSPPQRQT